MLSVVGFPSPGGVPGGEAIAGMSIVPGDVYFSRSLLARILVISARSFSLRVHKVLKFLPDETLKVFLTATGP